MLNIFIIPQSYQLIWPHSNQHSGARICQSNGYNTYC